MLLLKWDNCVLLRWNLRRTCVSATTIAANNRANAKHANDVDPSRTAVWFAMVVDDVRLLTTTLLSVQEKQVDL